MSASKTIYNSIIPRPTIANATSIYTISTSFATSSVEINERTLEIGHFIGSLKIRPLSYSVLVFMEIDFTSASGAEPAMLAGPCDPHEVPSG